MDYEKKYKDALKRAKELISKWTGKNKDFYTADYAYIFPELKESKDERIIEEIKFAVMQMPSERQDTKQRCLTWLEKQKEPTTEELYAEAGTTEKEYIANTMKMVRAMREKKQVQKPVEINFEDWDTLGYIRDIVRKHVRRDEEFNVLDKWLTEHYVNQKPADKEQDSIAFLEQYGYTIVPPHAPVSIVPSSEATFTEWSEEDEKMVKFYVDDYNNNLGNMPMRDVIENRIKFKDWLLNRLKSLRPQPKQGKKGLILTEEQEKKFGHLFTRPSWKPSEEQMNCLCAAVDAAIRKHNESVSGYKPARVLKSLYEDLQRL